MTITFDKYTNKYFIAFTESNVVSFSFEELEQLGESIHQVVQDSYSQQLQNDLAGEYICDGCSI